MGAAIWDFLVRQDSGRSGESGNVSLSFWKTDFKEFAETGSPRVPLGIGGLGIRNRVGPPQNVEISRRFGGRRYYGENAAVSTRR